MRRLSLSARSSDLFVSGVSAFPSSLELPGGFGRRAFFGAAVMSKRKIVIPPISDPQERRDYVEARKAQFLAAYKAMTPAERRLARALSEVVA